MATKSKIVPGTEITFIEFGPADIEQSLAQRFEQQVERHPDRVAVRDDRRTLTYRDLNAAANGLAKALRQRLPGPPSPVALLLGQDATALCGLLGALKAGHFYVPLDPTHPTERLQRLLRHVGADVVVTSEEYRALAETLAPAGSVLVADEVAPDDTDLAVTPAVAPETPAYVYYTSGSTGEPKGVIQLQRNVLHYVMVSTNELRISANDATSMISYYGAAAAASDFFGALLNGAAVHPFDLRRHGVGALGDWVEARALTLFHCVPTVLRRLDRELPPDRRFPTVRVVRLGGEPVTRRDVEVFWRRFGSHCRLGVSYGSTERNVITRFWIGADTPIPTHVVPIGYETPGVSVFVAGPTLNRLPPGEVGQTVVRSAFLSPGYWNRPDLTEKVFRPDPAGGPERLYLTGDLGRMDADGCLTHLGRLDAQVKVHGNRVETLEVEAALLDLPEVQEAVVSAVADEAAGSRLIAYVSLADGVPLDPRRLRTALAATLPVHMLPSAFVPVARMPLLPGGKLDRRSLPAPPPAARGSSSQRAPRGPAEQRMLAIWRNVLADPGLGPDDDFFELGGDSLQVVALMTEIRRAFGVDLPPNTLLQHSTAAALAALVPDAELQGLSVLSGERSGGLESARLSFWFPGGVAEEEGLLRCAMLERALRPDWRCHVLDVRSLAASLPQGSDLAQLAAECVKEVLNQQPQGPYLLGGLCAGGLIAYETACQLLERGARVAALVLRDTVCPGTPLAARGSGGLWRRISRTAGEIRALQRGERLPHLLRNAATGLHLVADRFDPAGQARRRYRALLRAYRPRPFPGPVTLIASDSWATADPTLGWSAASLGSLEVLRVPGDHQTWNQAQVASTAEHVRECFARTLAAPD